MDSDVHVVGGDDQPLRVVLLHGHGGSPEAMLAAADALAVALPVQVVLPRGPVAVGDDHAWWPVGEAAAPASVDAVAAVVAGDGRPTVLAGFSQGAAMAALVAWTHPSPLVRGLALVAGFLPDELAAPPAPDAAAPAHALAPVLVVHGDGDEAVDPMHGRLLARWCARVGAPVDVVSHEGGHDWTPAVHDAVVAWLAPRVPR
jgi:predicted esterase